MGRFHLRPPPVTPAVLQSGVTLHHRTDEAFHGHPWFTERVRSLRAALEAQGIERGPARAIAHVGPEMLLDGALLPANLVAVDATFVALRRHRVHLAPWTERTVDWEAHLDRLIAQGLPTDYGDATAVGHRLVRILSHRPRLELPEHQVQIVIGELERRHEAIGETANAFLGELVAFLGTTSAIRALGL